jgi:hypothetical protein
MADNDAGGAYAAFIVDQLGEERNRKTTLEGRGIVVINTSSALATLLFALTAVVTGAAKFRMPGSARLPLLLALVSFVCAAICGLLANVPLRYREPKVAGLAKLVDPNYWSGPREIGELRVAGANVEALASARSANGLKVMLLLLAVGFEILAVISLSWTIAGILYST